MVPFLRPVAVWLAFILTESLLGALRTVVTDPDVERFARQAGVGVGALLILGFSWLSLRWMRIRSLRAALAVGTLWVALTVAFEVALGRATGASWARILADYDLGDGGFMGLGLAIMALSPWAALALHNRPSGGIR
jgi:hypothetical protein